MKFPAPNLAHLKNQAQSCQEALQPASLTAGFDAVIRQAIQVVALAEALQDLRMKPRQTSHWGIGRVRPCGPRCPETACCWCMFI